MGCERGVSASTLLDFFNQLQVNLPVVLQNVKNATQARNLKLHIYWLHIDYSALVLQNVKIVTQGQGPVGGINAVDEGIKEEPASEEEVLSFPWFSVLYLPIMAWTSCGLCDHRDLS